MNEKEKNETWKNWILVVIILVVALIVLLFNLGHSPNSEPNKNVSTENSMIDDNTTDNDTNFKNWMMASFAVINEDLGCISKAGKKRNFTDTERCGRLLKENSDISLGRANKYNVSTSLQIMLDEYKKALEDYYVGGMNLEIGARNKDILQMDDAIKYIQNGNAHIDRIDNMSYEDRYGNISNTTRM